MSLFLNLMNQEHYKNTKNIVYNMLSRHKNTENILQNNALFKLKNTSTVSITCDQNMQDIFNKQHECLNKHNTDYIINYNDYIKLFENNVIKLKITFENNDYNTKLKKVILTVFRLIENKSQTKLCGLICKIDNEAINLLNPFRILNILKQHQQFIESNQEIILYAFHAKTNVENPCEKYENHKEYLNILKHYLNNFEKNITAMHTDKKIYDNIYEIYTTTDTYPNYNLKIMTPNDIDLVKIKKQEYDYQIDINKIFFADTITENIVYPYSSIILFKTISKGYASIFLGYSHGNISPYTYNICYGNYPRLLENIKYFTCVNAQSAYVGPISIAKEPLLWLFRDKEITKTILKNYLLMKFQTVL